MTNLSYPSLSISHCCDSREHWGRVSQEAKDSQEKLPSKESRGGKNKALNLRKLLTFPRLTLGHQHVQHSELSDSQVVQTSVCYLHFCFFKESVTSPIIVNPSKNEIPLKCKTCYSANILLIFLELFRLLS